MTDFPLLNTEMLQRLLGANAYSRVILVTTMWETLKGGGGEERFREISEKWTKVSDKQSTITRHYGTAESGWAAVESLITNSN
jgi:hypothetical protein